MPNNSLSKSSTANGQIVIDCDSGCIGIVYGSNIWSVFPSVPTGWTNATSSNGSTFAKATGTGGALGQKLVMYSLTVINYSYNFLSDAVQCSNNTTISLSTGNSVQSIGTVGYLAYRAL